jgi:PAS domain S-box-containing protein
LPNKYLDMPKRIIHFLAHRYNYLSMNYTVVAGFVIILCGLVAIFFSLNGANVLNGFWSKTSSLLLIALSAGSAVLLLVIWFAKHLRRETQLNLALHIAEENYQALTNQSLVGVAKVDSITGQYLAVNQRLCTMTGYTSEEMLRMTLYDVTHPDDRENTKNYLTVGDNTPFELVQAFQKRYIHKNGTIVYAFISSHTVKNTQTGIIERIGLIQDISAFITSQAKIKEQENRLSIIIHNSMDAIITIDTDENILIFNAAAEAMFGYLAQDALKMSLAKLIPQSFRAGHHAHVRAFSQSGDTARKMGSKLILKGLRANGEEFPLDASISRAVSEGKVYMTVILRDLTRQVKAQNELDRARTELRELSIASQTAREEEKSRISRELHDELGQNLTALKMDLSWLQGHTPDDALANLERIRAMQGILDSTVVATRRIAADLRPMMLDDLGLKAALEWLTQDFTRRLSIPCNLLVDEEVTQLDSPVQSALYRAVQECLTNISRHAQATQVHIEVHLSTGEVTLQVSDNGVGMSDEVRSKRGSFGLIGMRERIYILGGSVTIDSQPGLGARITVNLPCTPSAQEASPLN